MSIVSSKLPMPLNLSKVIKHFITAIACFLIFVNMPLCAQHYIQNGSMRVSINVTKKGVDLPLDSLCDGFDPETNHPINLVIPEKSSIVVSTDPSLNILSYMVNSQQPKYVNEPSKGAGFSTSASPGSQNTYTFIDETTSDTLRIHWKVDYAKVELIDLFPAGEFTNYVSFQFQNLFEEYPKTSQYDWSQEEFISRIDERGIPIHPEFPHSRDDLFFVVENVTEEAVIQLKGYHQSPQLFDENNPFDLFVYVDLPDGTYEYVVRPFDGAPDSKSLFYSFTILKPWWFQESAIAGFTFLLTMIGVGISFLIYRRRQRKREQVLEWKQRLSEAELKAIRAQLNPHFLFNALSSIQNLVARKRNETANTYLTKLSRLLRNVLSASEHTFHELRSELGLIELYLELEKLRYPFDFQITIGEEVSLDTLTPVMLFQPFVENAIKHGVAGRNGGKVELRVNSTPSTLIVEILDNGQGLATPNENSSGLQLSRDRIRPLNDLYGKEASIEIGNREDQNGVRVHITLPLN